MIELKGKRNSAIIFAEKIDKEAKTQLAALLREEAFADAKIRIMPDVHAGKNAVVGTTMTLNGRILPALLGVDIGCGVEVVFLEEKQVDLPALDRAVHDLIPCGAKINAVPVGGPFDFSALHCGGVIDREHALRSLGSLGGGNHFIEMDRAADGSLLLLIHSGSRRLGSDVAVYYRELAFREACRAERRQTGRKDRSCCGEWAYDGEEYACRAVRRENRSKLHVTRENAVLRGERFRQYVHDVGIVQAYAERNRRVMAERICAALGLHIRDRFSCVHNYIDTEHGILRKGAISARAGERVIIPLNMRDGAVLGRGKGNPAWNFSAPHGAGRACSRIEARHLYTVEEFQREMSGIYTTTAEIGSLDECPMAYKPARRILDAIGGTVEAEEIVRPVYNFKAC